MSEEVVPRDELRATIEARKELGEDAEPALIDAFVSRIEKQLSQRQGESEQSLRRKREHQKEMVLGARDGSLYPALRPGCDLHRPRRCNRRLRSARGDRDRHRALVTRETPGPGREHLSEQAGHDEREADGSPLARVVEIVALDTATCVERVTHGSRPLAVHVRHG